MNAFVVQSQVDSLRNDTQSPHTHTHTLAHTAGHSLYPAQALQDSSPTGNHHDAKSSISEARMPSGSAQCGVVDVNSGLLETLSNSAPLITGSNITATTQFDVLLQERVKWNRQLERDCASFFHEVLNTKVKHFQGILNCSGELAKNLTRNCSRGPRLLLVGDSITQMWTGTHQCAPTENLQGIRSIFNSFFIQRYGSAGAFAIAGDTSMELVWRLRQIRSLELRPRVVLLHIGINDISSLGAVFYKLSVAKRHIWMTQHGLTHPKSKMNPRGDLIRNADKYARKVVFAVLMVVQELWLLGRPRILLSLLFPSSRYWPEGPYGAMVPRVNALLQRLGELRSDALDLDILNCQGLALDTAGRIDTATFPDYLHPSPEGYRRWASCITAKLDQLLPLRASESVTC